MSTVLIFWSIFGTATKYKRTMLFAFRQNSDRFIYIKYISRYSTNMVNLCVVYLIYRIKINGKIVMDWSLGDYFIAINYN